VRDAGSLAPVPYIEKAAEIVLRILVGIQASIFNLAVAHESDWLLNCSKSRETAKNFRELAEDMVDMVKMIEETLGQPRPQESRFPQTCNHLLA
jgi:hypothetical protein